MNSFFVLRPVFAWVVALFILLFGAIALLLLPVEQYPNIAPPSISISTNYRGADAATIDRNVTSIIEEDMNGLDGFLYMSSVSRPNGSAQITVTFAPGTDLDVARGQVQDRLSRVESLQTAFSEVATALERRGLFDAEQRMPLLRAAQLQNGVSLYVALGGGDE